MGNKTSSESEKDHHDNQEIFPDDSLAEANQNRTNNKKSYYTLIKQSYQALVNAIIRPPRCGYEISQLGPRTFNFCGKIFERLDFCLENPRKLKFECSMWQPVDKDRQNSVIPCVIYMHGNSSSRLEALPALSLVLSLGASLLSFDFSGSGKSEGEYVSLGAFEKDDLQCVIEHLRTAGNTSTIALWGRSMGAATALLHGERDPSIAGMVLDSAFASLTQLAEEMVEKGRSQGMFAPGILVSIVMKFVRSSVQSAADFDIRKLAPIDQADKCFIPALFVAADGDNFVSMNHSKMIHNKYGGDKNIIIVDGDHNSPRPRFLYDSVAIFLTTTLQIPEDWVLAEGHNYIRRMPWTYRATVQRGQKAASTTSSSGAGAGASSSSLLPSSAHHSRNNSDNSFYPSLGIDGAGLGLSMDEMVAFSLMYGGGDGSEEADIDLDEILHQSYLASVQHRNSNSSDLSTAETQMQRDVQTRLFDLMSAGTGSTLKGSSSSSRTKAPAEMSSANTAERLEPKAAKENAQKLLNESDSDFEDEILGSTSHSKAADNNGSVSGGGGGSSNIATTAIIHRRSTEAGDNNMAAKSDRSSWACGTCTLINETNHDFCEACGVEKCEI